MICPSVLEVTRYRRQKWISSGPHSDLCCYDSSNCSISFAGRESPGASQMTHCISIFVLLVGWQNRVYSCAAKVKAHYPSRCLWTDSSALIERSKQCLWSFIRAKQIGAKFLQSTQDRPSFSICRHFISVLERVPGMKRIGFHHCNLAFYTIKLGDRTFTLFGYLRYKVKYCVRGCYRNALRAIKAWDLIFM